MVRIKNFNEFLEQDLERLAANIKEHQTLEGENRLLPREVIKESLEALTEQPAMAPAENQAAVSQKEMVAPAIQPAPTSFLPAYLIDSQNTAEIQNKIQHLIKLAFKEGLAEAIKEAKNYPPFIEDAFHDALIDKLMPELKKRGLC